MILIYTHKITTRVQYTFKLIFTTILGVEVNITDNKDEFLEYIGVKLSYTKKRLATELFFYAKPLLFEKGIKEQEINVFDFEDTIAFFENSSTSAVPFDLFAASFYLVSRYEECLPHIRDQYDRFNVHESLAYKSNFLQKPVVNNWAQKIKSLIKTKFPDFEFPKQSYKYTSTLDIDNAYAFKEKGFIRTLGSYLSAIGKWDVKGIVYRTQVLLGLKKDPFDTYSIQLNIHKKYKLHPIYFFLVGDYDLNDKNISIHRTKYQSLIKSIADHADIGIHPSFNSNKDVERLKKEVDALAKVIKREPTKSRQHFLKLTLPDTYRNLIDLDICDDYSMGYATEIGFRASICTPFNFYDLDFETETNLTIHPFCIMDATRLYHIEIKPDNVSSYISEIIEEVKKVDGHLITLWHNESFSEFGAWKGWGQVYEKVIKLAIGKP